MKLKKKLYCCVPGCYNNNLTQNISFHYFPRDCILKNKWVEACKIQEFITKDSRVCNEHFKKEYFHNYEKKCRRKLKKFAIPQRKLPISQEEACQFKLFSWLTNQYYNNQEMDCSFSSKHADQLGCDFRKQMEPEHTDEIINNDFNNRDDPCDGCLLNDNSIDNQDEPCEGRLLNDNSIDNQDESCNGRLLNENSTNKSQLSESSDLSIANILIQLKNACVQLPESRVKNVVEKCIQTEESKSKNEEETIVKEIKKDDKSIQFSSRYEITKRFSILDYIDDAELYDLAGVHSNTLSESVDCVTYIAIENNESIEGKYLLSVQEMIILTLAKLRHDLSFVFLRLLFGITRQSCANYFKLILPLLSLCLKGMEYWPEKDEILNNMPSCFESFQDTRIVLDCTEIPVQKRCHIRLYSHYYGRTTMKFLIGMSPCGIITYHSDTYGGKASDKEIFLQSKILDLLSPGDAVMVDKGFLIRKECDERNIRLIRPVFATDKEQFTKEEALMTTKIAAARVHVERIIERIKKWKILKSTILWATAPYIDDIITIIIGLVNLSSPILADKRFE